MKQMYQCPKCGGQILPQADGTSGVCEYCGAVVAIPKSNATLLNRANMLRMRREFDQAQILYRNVARNFPEDPEAWWGSVLCEYGIEYVESNGERIPTLNRMKYDLILENEDCKRAIACAGETMREVYREEAARIQEIQSRLLEIAAKQDPYDIFICFKDKDENGNRTMDSVLAQEIYDQLEKEGYRVFFSRKTLRAAVGQDFEPLIFSALQSSVLMIMVSCQKEHYHAVWVKNEWSRYLKQMKTRAEKHLLPVFADVDPEDMPEEFRGLQGINAARIGYMQDLIENVHRICGMRNSERVTHEKNGEIHQRIQKETDLYLELGAAALRCREKTLAKRCYQQAAELDATRAEVWWRLFLLETNDLKLSPGEMGKKKQDSCYVKAMQYARAEQKAHYLEQMETAENDWRQATYEKELAEMSMLCHKQYRDSVSLDICKKRYQTKRQHLLELSDGKLSKRQAGKLEELDREMEMAETDFWHAIYEEKLTEMSEFCSRQCRSSIFLDSDKESYQEMRQQLLELSDVKLSKEQAEKLQELDRKMEQLPAFLQEIDQFEEGNKRRDQEYEQLAERYKDTKKQMNYVSGFKNLMVMFGIVGLMVLLYNEYGHIAVRDFYWIYTEYGKLVCFAYWVYHEFELFVLIPVLPFLYNLLRFGMKWPKIWKRFKLRWEQAKILKNASQIASEYHRQLEEKEKQWRKEFPACSEDMDDNRGLIWLHEKYRGVETEWLHDKYEDIR